MEIYVFTDGSCLGNGLEAQAAGYGIHFPNHQHRDVGRPFTKLPMTNQRAELYALYRALKITTSSKVPIPYQKIILCTDSNYSIQCLTSWASHWEKNGWINSKKKPVKNQDLIKPLYRLYQKHQDRIELKHVKAHTGKSDFFSLGNAEADRLAVRGSNKLTGKQKPTK